MQPMVQPKAKQSNWIALRSKLSVTAKPKTPKVVSSEASTPTPAVAQSNKWHSLLKDRILAIDCEMVGIGFSGKVSALARCSVVDFDGKVIYDEFVQPKDHVTDFRTKWSGIRKTDITTKNAVQLEEVSTPSSCP